MSTALLRFAGPMQSWGTSQFHSRNTEGVPTRRGVVGLLGACVGDLPAWLDDLDIVVRVERGGRQEEDFHTVNPAPQAVAVARGRYRAIADGTPLHQAEPIEHVVTQAGGGKWVVKKKLQPEVTRRRYLADAEFLVAISHPDEAVMAELAAAVARPHFTPFLGRKAFSPAYPFWFGLHDDSPVALLSKLPTLGLDPQALPLHPIVGDQNPASSHEFVNALPTTTEVWVSWKGKL